MIHEILPVGMLECNCSIFGDETSKEAIVIDPGDDVRDILEVLARHELKVKAIVITHAHIDHIGGAARLKAVTGAPVLEKAGFMDGWAGSYEITPDRNPIIDCNIGGIQGFHCAAGFSGHGFMHGPAAGLLLAEEIMDGRAHTLDISALNVRRFREGRTIREHVSF